MPSIAVFVRKTPRDLLRRYLAYANIVLQDSVTWDEPTSTPIIKAIDALDRDAHERVMRDFGRVAALADEAGQNALYGVAGRPLEIDTLPSGHARALWVYICAPDVFRRAEEVRYTDDRRRGKQWSGFLGDPDAELQRDDETIERFKQSVREQFGSPNVHVDVFDRHKRRLRGDLELVQATVYLEDRPDQLLEFINGQLDVRDHRPVIEASLTYEPESGSIEVVAKNQETRETFVRLFAENLLRSEFNGEPVPVRRYEIDKLRRPFAFPTDASDGIERVRINSMRLMPLDTASQRVTLECLRGEEGMIWDVSAARFGAADPLRNGWLLTQVKFTITFHREPRSSVGKTLPVTITMPHGCDLKDRTERERLVGEKYLREWGLLQDL